MADVIQRMRPWLGTFVEIRAEGLVEAESARVIEAAFAEIAVVHRRMSFHAADSDLARLHRAPVGAGVRVDARTREVLECALRIAAASDGCFDPTIAAQQVGWGFLPRPDSPFAPDPCASWRDIELVDDDCVRLRRPLWLDLGGIAKGYAVDRAIEILIAAGATQAGVNAGGDLRLFGSRTECIHLRTSGGFHEIVPGIELTNAAVASSAGLRTRRRVRGRWQDTHVHGRERRPVGALSSVSVVAEHCIVADALTKVVLAASVKASRAVLAAFGAHACTHDSWHGWRILEDAA